VGRDDQASKADHGAAGAEGRQRRYIELTWPDGRSEQIGGFQPESEIGDWISR